MLGWRSVMRERQSELAAHVRRFSGEIPPPQTEKELMARAIVNQTRDASTVEGAASASAAVIINGNDRVILILALPLSSRLGRLGSPPIPARACHSSPAWVCVRASQ